LKHRFLKTTRKTSALVELIERKKRYDAVHAQDDSTEEEPGGKDQVASGPSWEWDETVKGAPTQAQLAAAGVDPKKPDTKSSGVRTTTKPATPTSTNPTTGNRPPTTTNTSASAVPAANKHRATGSGSSTSASTSSTSASTAASNDKRPKHSDRDKHRKDRGDKKPARKKPAGEKPSALTSIIYPALDRVIEASKDQRVSEALQHLRECFDNAESAQSGLTHALIAQIIETLKR